jgi:hypothetical protein
MILCRSPSLPRLVSWPQKRVKEPEPDVIIGTCQSEDVYENGQEQFAIIDGDGRYRPDPTLVEAYRKEYGEQAWTHRIDHLENVYRSAQWKIFVGSGHVRIINKPSSLSRVRVISYSVSFQDCFILTILLLWRSLWGKAGNQKPPKLEGSWGLGLPVTVQTFPGF